MALSAEAFVLKVAKVPHNNWGPYLGRSQYPKFKNKPVVAKPPAGRYTYDPDVEHWLTFRNQVVSLATEVNACRASFGSTQASLVVNSLNTSLKHLSNLPPPMKKEWEEFVISTQAIDWYFRHDTFTRNDFPFQKRCYKFIE